MSKRNGKFETETENRHLKDKLHMITIRQDEENEGTNAKIKKRVGSVQETYEGPGYANKNENKGNNGYRETTGKNGEAEIACGKVSEDYYNSEGIKRASTTIGVRK